MPRELVTHQNNVGSSLSFLKNLKTAWDLGQKTAKYGKRVLADRNNKQHKNKKQKTGKRNKSTKSVARAGSSGPYSVANGSSRKSVQRVVGKLNLKKTKAVHVSKKFKASVEKVLEGDSAKGEFITVISGVVGAVVGAATTAGDDLNTTQTGFVGPLITASAGGRSLFNQLVDYRVGSAAVIVPGSGMNYFTPGKILDAASVLFNSKGLNINQYIQTGNMSTDFNPTTGAAGTGNPGTLKINVLRSEVLMTMKNLSGRVITLEIWECVPTIKFQQANALASLVGTTAVETQNASFDAPIVYYSTTAPTLQTDTYTEGNIDPCFLMKRLGFKFTWKKRTIIFQPEETFVHTIKGPKGILDFAKLFSTDVANNSSQTLNLGLLKGWSVSVIMSVRGDQVIENGTGAVSVGARRMFANVAGQILSCPIGVEIKETYKVAVPEIAGFVTQNGAAGTTQMLNRRKDKLIIWNKIPANGTTLSTAGQPSVANEENPELFVNSGQLI